MQPTGTECAQVAMDAKVPMKEAAVASPRPSMGGLAAGGLVLGAGVLWAYWTTLAEMKQRWATDPQYSHGFLVPLFALVLLWYRRDLLGRNASLRVNWWGLPLLLIGMALRLASAQFYFGWLDGISLLPTAAGAVLLLGGWPLLRWSWPAIGFLIFMLPLPFRAEVALSQPLRRIATVASTYLLQTLGLPAIAEGNTILLNDFPIGVAEACSGLSMLLTFFALTSGVVLVVRRPLLDKVVLLLSAAPIALMANIARITTTGVVGTFFGPETGKQFHDQGGWFMMPVGLGLLWLEVWFLSRLLVTPESTRPLPLPVLGGAQRLAPPAVQA